MVTAEELSAFSSQLSVLGEACYSPWLFGSAACPAAPKLIAEG